MYLQLWKLLGALVKVEKEEFINDIVDPAEGKFNHW